MQAFFERIKKLLKAYLFLAYQKAKPALDYLKVYYDRVAQYYRTHPRARKWSIIGAIVLGPPLLFLLVVWIEIPSKRELRNIQNQVASEIYSADSVLLGRYYIQDRTEVKYDDIAPVVFDALIATEDARFYDHSGVDYVSLGRVLVKSIFLQDESAGGGSTITQQLSKNLYPRKRYWILAMPLNKMREVITAVRLEDMYPKKDLITLYLNTIPFADHTFGIEAAAKRFFSCTAKQLTASQAALLIGMLKATHRYNPRLFAERALKRRNVVFTQMNKYGFLTQQSCDSLKKLPLKLNYSKNSYQQGLAPYFREYLKTELFAWCKQNFKSDGTPYNIYTDGLKIYTTIDSRMQAYAEQAVEQQMTEVQKLFFAHWGRQLPWEGKEGVIEDAIHRSERYQRMKEDGMSEKDIMVALQKKIPTRKFNWKGEEDVVMSPLDSIKHHIQFLNAGFVAMEPRTGKLKAWVGGINYDFFQFDHAKTSTKRQVGSIFKPIVYAMALEQNIAPCDFISAERKTYIDNKGEKWTPRNSQIDYEVEYSMPGALAYSVNTVAVKLIEAAGVQNTISLAREMGIVSELPDALSLSLGSASISLLEMTTAFACLGNEGVTSKPYCISSIHDADGKIVTFKQAPGKRVMSKETAILVRRMMETVVHEGTASRLRWKYGIYSDVAGKTGTTQSNADGWFMAVTPDLVAGSWVGADDPRIRFRNTELGQGSSTALPIFGYFMKQVTKDTAFAKLSKSKFTPVPNELQEKLSCDLYELNDELIQDILHSLYQKDSLIQADTTATPRPDSFLETLYKRKQKIQRAGEKRDSAAAAQRQLSDQPF
jgi:penicillin-binding protein 1A